MARFTRFWAPLLVYQAILFALSSRPAVPLGVPVWDKALHFGAYAILAVLWARVIPRSTGRPLTARAFVPVALAVLFGVFDEFHQSFVPGRDASGADLLADALGATCAAFLLRWRGNPGPAI